MYKLFCFFKASLTTLILIFLLSFFQEITAQTVYLEWVDDPLESIVINWIDDSGETSTVDYRKIGAGSWTTETGSEQSIPGPTSKYLYTVNINGLTAGQGYEFRVGGNSTVHKFRTPPASLDEPIKFIVGGDILDTGSDLTEAKEDFVEVSKIAASHDPYFVVIGGDLANGQGQLENVDQWFFLFETWYNQMVTDDGFMIPIVSALGNNDVDGDFGQSPEEAPFYYTFFQYPQDQWEDEISYGKLDFNDYLSIITLDTDHTHRIPGFQTEWLNNTLRNRRNFRHVIPIYHVAAWPTFKSRSLFGTQENLVRNNWHKVFESNDVRLVFEHHDHIYKRTYPIGDCDDEIRNERSCENAYGNDALDGVIYMGGGSWGSDNNRPAEKRWYHEKVVDKLHNFVVVEIADNYRTASAIGENDQVLDSFTDYVHLAPPQVLAPEVTSDNSFIARWEEVEGASIYRIDVSTESDFTPIWEDYEYYSTGKNTEIEIDDLDPEKIYYYRVRAQNVLTTSDYSEAVEVQLVKVDPDQSTVTVSKETVEANNEETSTITATIIDEEGELVTNFRISLFALEGQLKAEDSTVSTNEEGKAEFHVFNDKAERVTYVVTAGTVELNQTVQVTFIPVAPVTLSATEVKNREFTANWEVVNDADSYELDVATDSEFTNIVSGYEGLDVGNSTSHTITGMNPGTTYYYRVRAITNDLTGANSQDIEVTTYPDTPIANEPSANNVVSFIANWEMAEGAQKYRLDVARDSNFENFVEGYQNMDVGNGLNYKVDGLLPGREYFYRIRAEAEQRLSEASNVIQTETTNIDIEASKIESSQLRVLANGDQTNEIYIEVIDENGDLQEGVPVQVSTNNSSSKIEAVEPVTNEEGVATFGVTNTQAEKVTYSITAATVEMGKITVEFIQAENELSLGNNFPNPFRMNSSIPLQIPRSMHVQLTVYNSLGAPVRQLLDEKLDVGYYEIPFNGSDLAAGVYFYRLITDEDIKTRKMVLVK